MTDTAQIYDEAADLIEKNGWLQYHVGRMDGHGPHCLLGALRVVYPNTKDTHDPIRTPLTTMLYREGRISRLGYAAFFWNDDLPRKNGKRTVIRALRRAARQLREGKLS